MGFDQTLAVIFCLVVMWVMMQMRPDLLIGIVGLGSFFYVLGG